MSIGKQREAMTQVFNEVRAPSKMLQRFFTTKKNGRSQTSRVSIDVRREEEHVAVAIRPGSPVDIAGPELHDADDYTSKSFEPPSYNPGTVIPVQDLLDRYPGQSPFEAPEFRVDLRARMFDTMGELHKSVVRAIEVQASQVLQTGVLSLVDRAGNVAYTIDYKPKATHFPTVGTSWTNPAANAAGDLEDVCEVVKDDSGIVISTAVMGREAFRNFRKNTDIQAQLNYRRGDFVAFKPELREGGGTLQGRVNIGDYAIDIWTYNATYLKEDTSVRTKYVDVNNVILLSEDTRLDKLTAAPARPLGEDPLLAPFNPGRLQGDEFDAEPFLWTPDNRRSLHGELGTRTLLVPVQIDGFACLDTIL